ncbi:MAG: hypothetical protein HKP13_01080, partial [Gammaproteobacteria bacterium]|nr:hypothetical protein [Gammaproteobacteria bacterium]
MSTKPEQDDYWLLTQALLGLRGTVRREIAQSRPDLALPEPGPEEQNVDGAIRVPAQFVWLADYLALSTFEQNLLLLCLGAEIDPVLPKLYQIAGDNPRPSIGLALRFFRGEWVNLSPQSPLRRWHLVLFQDPKNILHSPVFLAERTLHFLLGTACIDSALAGYLKPLAVRFDLIHCPAIQTLIQAWGSGDPSGAMLTQLQGSDQKEREQTTVSIAEALA